MSPSIGIANCLTFKEIRTISQVIYQEPGGFPAKIVHYF